MSFDLWPEIQDAIHETEILVADMRDRGREKAEAEAHYYTIKAKRAFALKEAGQPVTFITLVIKGDEEVNDAMRKFHACEVEYDNAREAVMCAKKKLDTLREQMQREWGQAGRS